MFHTWVAAEQRGGQARWQQGRAQLRGGRVRVQGPHRPLACCARLPPSCSHDWINQGYTWLTPSAVDERLHHPSPRRQQLVQLMMAQQAQQARQPRHEGAQQPGAAD